MNEEVDETTKLPHLQACNEKEQKDKAAKKGSPQTGTCTLQYGEGFETFKGYWNVGRV